MEPGKIVDYKKQGKANRAKGARFELKVRENLERDGWVVDKWTNNVDLENEKICPAKRAFNPFTKKLQGIGMGFPDFVAFMPTNSSRRNHHYTLLLCECKTNGQLSKIEKEKMNFLIKKGFNCWIAYKGNTGGVNYKKLQQFKFKKTKEIQ